MKRILALIIAIGFVGSASLSFFAMDHSQMVADCEMSPGMYVSICGGEMSSTAAHYISMYQSFTNVTFSQVVTQVIPPSLLILFIVVLCNYVPLIPQLLILSRGFCVRVHTTVGITRWLSLLLNSPSFH